MKIIIDTETGKILAQSIGVIEAKDFKSYGAFVKEVTAAAKKGRKTPQPQAHIPAGVADRQKASIQNQIELLQTRLSNLKSMPTSKLPSRLPANGKAKATVAKKKTAKKAK